MIEKKDLHLMDSLEIYIGVKMELHTSIFFPIEIIGTIAFDYFALLSWASYIKQRMPGFASHPYVN